MARRANLTGRADRFFKSRITDSSGAIHRSSRRRFSGHRNEKKGGRRLAAMTCAHAGDARSSRSTARVRRARAYADIDGRRTAARRR
ncbi:hypothetical protein BURPS305_7191 [Burkholderia pseudomallei 305]|nr:hypothetical protein BURPS305_7191 [Burkholderia pseudomallei 305]